MNISRDPHIAVVIPAYKVTAHIVDVIRRIGPEVGSIFVVDDKCPENSGSLVESAFANDSRITVLYNAENQGVGGAVVKGYEAALNAQADIIVKVDGDGQMPPEFVPRLIQPILSETADYTKGNRFYTIDSLQSMPGIRILGNAALSFISKVSNGYYNIMDPTNGFTAIHRKALEAIPLQKLEKRYFFENDILFRLNTIRAVVRDVPMDAIYGDEESNLSISKTLLQFPPKFLSRLYKRIFYNYFLRDFNMCSLELCLGTLLCLLGGSFGLWHWWTSGATGTPASPGTVMLAGLPILIGLNLLIAAISFDIANVPKEPLQQLFKDATFQKNNELPIRAVRR